MADWIFLDHHTKTSPSEEIVKQFAHDILLPKSKYWLLESSKIEKAKERLRGLVGGADGEVVLTTAGPFQSLFSHYVHFIRETGKTHILSLETEDLSLLDGIKSLEKFEVSGKLLPVNEQGQLTSKVLQEAIRARSGLLSLSWAHPLTGVVQPIRELMDLCTENDIRIHLDITTALGKLPIPFDGLNVDFLTFDGRLLNCPPQMGALIVKKGIKIEPFQFGFHEESYPHLAALSSGVEKASDKIDHYALEVARLRDDFETKMLQIGAKVLFQEVERLPNCAVVCFEGVHAECLLFYLQRQGIFATTGQGRLSSVLKSCHIDPVLAHTAINFVLSDETTQEEIDRTVQVCKEQMEKWQVLGGLVDATL